MDKWIIPIVALVVASGMHLASAFSPTSGDYFKYYETQELNQGTGTYSGYWEHTIVTGEEHMNSISNGVVSADYKYSWTFTNSSGSHTTGGKSNPFTYSTDNFQYLNGTDDQNGYTNPTVWFAMPNDLPVGAKFESLNTEMTIVSKNYSYFVPSLNKNVTTIMASGAGNYARNDIYGKFVAPYTFTEYFDPATGYIVGYTYFEKDSNSDATFDYSENFYVTDTSYSLTPVQNTPEFPVALPIAALVTVFVIVATRLSKRH